MKINKKLSLLMIAFLAFQSVNCSQDKFAQYKDQEWQSKTTQDYDYVKTETEESVNLKHNQLLAPVQPAQYSTDSSGKGIIRTHVTFKPAPGDKTKVIKVTETWTSRQPQTASQSQSSAIKPQDTTKKSREDDTAGDDKTQKSDDVTNDDSYSWTNIALAGATAALIGTIAYGVAGFMGGKDSSDGKKLLDKDSVVETSKPSSNVLFGNAEHLLDDPNNSEILPDLHQRWHNKYGIGKKSSSPASEPVQPVHESMQAAVKRRNDAILAQQNPRGLGRSATSFPRDFSVTMLPKRGILTAFALTHGFDVKHDRDGTVTSITIKTPEDQQAIWSLLYPVPAQAEVIRGRQNNSRVPVSASSSNSASAQTSFRSARSTSSAVSRSTSPVGSANLARPSTIGTGFEDEATKKQKFEVWANQQRKEDQEAVIALIRDVKEAEWLGYGQTRDEYIESCKKTKEEEIEKIRKAFFPTISASASAQTPFRSASSAISPLSASAAASAASTPTASATNSQPAGGSSRTTSSNPVLNVSPSGSASASTSSSARSGSGEASASAAPSSASASSLKGKVAVVSRPTSLAASAVASQPSIKDEEDRAKSRAIMSKLIKTEAYFDVMIKTFIDRQSAEKLLLDSFSNVKKIEYLKVLQSDCREEIDGMQRLEDGLKSDGVLVYPNIQHKLKQYKKIYEDQLASFIQQLGILEQTPASKVYSQQVSKSCTMTSRYPFVDFKSASPSASAALSRSTSPLKGRDVVVSRPADVQQGNQPPLSRVINTLAESKTGSAEEEKIDVAPLPRQAALESASAVARDMEMAAQTLRDEDKQRTMDEKFAVECSERAKERAATQSLKFKKSVGSSSPAAPAFAASASPAADVRSVTPARSSALHNSINISGADNATLESIANELKNQANITTDLNTGSIQGQATGRSLVVGSNLVDAVITGNLHVGAPRKKVPPRK